MKSRRGISQRNQSIVKRKRSSFSVKPTLTVEKRVVILFSFVMAFACILLMRAAKIQLIGDERLASLSRRQFQSKILIRPRRGLILDRQGRSLAVNTETKSLAANPEIIRKFPALVPKISRALGMPLRKVKQKVNRSGEFVWLKRHLSDKAEKKLIQAGLMDKRGDPVDGLWLVKESKRIYPNGSLASQVIGDVNIDSDGIEGLELYLNEKLSGNIVSLKAHRDGLGRPTFIDSSKGKEVKDGESVRITLDSALQFSVENELKKTMEETRSRSGSVIVMNAVTGEILSMANYPSFDPNKRGQPVEWRRNRIVTDGYEPGSVMKAILVGSALENGWKLKRKVWGGKGQIVIQKKRITEAMASEKFEWLNLMEVIQRSSNVASAKISLELGWDRFRKTLVSFGFGSKTGVGFPGEISGFLPEKGKIQDLRLANIGFGQGLLVTPLQIIRSYAVIANGGWLVRPKLLLNRGQNDPPVKILSKKSVDILRRALIMVTETDEGTGKSARLDGYVIAGKTGTAQVVDPKTRRYSSDRYISSFVGFPVSVDPPVVVYASVDSPKGNYLASATAAPLFRRVLGHVVNQLGIPKKADEQWKMKVAVEKLRPKRDQISQRNAAVLRKDPATMPDLAGFSSAEVLEILKGRDVKLNLNGFGFVKKQTPEAGVTLQNGQTITVEMGL